MTTANLRDAINPLTANLLMGSASGESRQRACEIIFALMFGVSASRLLGQTSWSFSEIASFNQGRVWELHVTWIPEESNCYQNWNPLIWGSGADVLEHKMGKWVFRATGEISEQYSGSNMPLHQMHTLYRVAKSEVALATILIDANRTHRLRYL